MISDVNFNRRRTSGKGERLSLVLLDFKWEMRLGQHFGTICSAGIRFWRKFFLISLVLLEWRMPQLLIIWRFWAVLLSGTWALLEKRMIGKWVSLLSSSRCCTQSWWVEIVQIRFDGSLPINDYSRSSPSSAPWLALKVDIFLGRVCGGLQFLRVRFFLRGWQP
jgi:hypothetical protein